MHWLQIEQNWPTYLPHARTNWQKLSRTDLEITVGRRDLLIRKLQNAYDLSYEDADHEIENWQRALS